MCKLRTAFLFLSLIFSYQITAVEKIVSIATLDDYLPFCFPNDKSIKTDSIIHPGADSERLQGYSWDIIRESFHASGYSIQLNVYPWVRAMETVKKGEVDLIFPAGRNAERESIYYYSNEAVNRVNFVVYTANNSILSWQGLSSIENKSIAAIRGWNYGDDWKNNTKIKKRLVGKINVGFKMLENKRIDGFAGYDVIFDYHLKTIAKEKVYTKTPIFGFTKEFVIGAKNNTRVVKLLTAFDKGKKIIIANGTFEKIVAKWK